MRADRRINAARAVELVVADDLFVERLAHAVQALEFVLSGRVIRPRESHHGGERLRVVGGELRIDGVRRREQFSRAGQIGNIGVDLAGIDREIGHPVQLSAFDLAVPIGALDEPNHQAAARPPREIDQHVYDLSAPLSVGLNDEAEAVPAGEFGIKRQRCQEIERQVEPLRFLGVDVEADIVGLRQHGEPLHGGQKLVHHARLLRARIARMQRRQFDRDARPLIRPAPGRRPPDGVDRLLVIGVIARGVMRGRRRFAQHVVGIGKPLRLHLARGLQRLVDGAAGDELLAHQPHRHVGPGANDRLARSRDQPRQSRR
jgi:hypothetical protein